MESIGVLHGDDLVSGGGSRLAYGARAEKRRREEEREERTDLIGSTVYSEDVHILWERMLEVVVIPFCERAELLLPARSSAQFSFGARGLPSPFSQLTPSQVIRLTTSCPATLTFQSTSTSL